MIKSLQPVYIAKILEKFHFDKANIVQIPIKKEVLLTSKIKSEALASKQKRY